MKVRGGKQRLRWRYKPFPELVRLSWPIVVQLISFSTMTMVDTLFVGRLGASSLAAVGIGGTVLFTVAAFAIGLFNGAKVRVSQAIGAGKAQASVALLGAFLRLSLLISLVVAAIALGAVTQLAWFSPDAETGRLSQSYMALRALAIPLVVFISALAQYRQGLGDSRAAMHAALLGNVVNAPLNALFIFGFDWGVAGAALATVCARMAELALLVKKVQRTLAMQQPKVSLLQTYQAATWQQALRLFRFASPAALERWLDGAAFTVLVLLIGSMGAAQVAAHQVVLQVVHFSLLPSVAIGEALAVLVAQAVGANMPALVRRVGLQALLLTGAYALATVIVVALFQESLLRVFTADPAVLAAARPTLAAALVMQFIHVPYVIGKALLRGMADLRFNAVVVVGCAWIFAPPLTYVFGVVANLGAAGGWWALCAETLVGVVLLGARLAGKDFFRQASTARVPARKRLAAVAGARA